MELTPPDILCVLEEGTIEMEGLVPWGSNYTFLVTVRYEPVVLQAIYKPRQGERPLWDFPSGTLCLRERAAYLVSEALEWHLVPPTILRKGPRGFGSVQFFIEHDPDETYFTFKEEYGDAHLSMQLQRVALFDILINNADRKGGHVIRDAEGCLWAIDHGIGFHTDYKLRTVIWDFAGQPLAPNLQESLTRLHSILDNKQHPLRVELNQLLNRYEIKALRRRLSNLRKRGRFVDPGPGRHYPWPLV